MIKDFLKYILKERRILTTLRCHFRNPNLKRNTLPRFKNFKLNFCNISFYKGKNYMLRYVKLYTSQRIDGGVSPMSCQHSSNTVPKTMT